MPARFRATPEPPQPPREEPISHRGPGADLYPLGRNTGVRVQVLRRQPDGSWLRIIERPEVPQP